MGAPWQKYQAQQPASAGPWAKYKPHTPTQQSIRYGAGDNPDAGGAATTDQQAYANANRLRYGPVGSPTNPYYATPSVPKPSDPNMVYVDQGGMLHVPQSVEDAVQLAKTTGDDKAGVGLSTWNGYTLNNAARLRALGQAVRTGALNAFGAGPGYGAGDAYKATMGVEKGLLQGYQAEHPGRDFAGTVVGGLLNPFSIAGGEYVGAAKGVLPAMGRGALVGGAEGGAAGGPEGAATGAVLGGLTPGAGAMGGKTAHLASDIGKNLKRTVGLASPEEVAQERLAEAMTKDVKAGATPQATLANWAGASKPTLADVAGENVRAVVRDAGTQGPARQTLARYRDQVAADLQDNALELTGRLTPGETRTAPQYQAGLRADQTAAADQMYPAFQGDQIPVDDVVTGALSGKAGANALSHAQTIADTLRDWTTKDELANLAANGVQPGTVSAGALDLVRRGLRDSSGEAYKAGNNTVAGGLKGRAADLETALMQSPGFDAARKTFQRYANQIDAVDNGAGVLNQPPSTYLPLVSGAQPEVLQGVQVGARQSLADAIGRPTEGATGLLNRISTATNAGENLAGTFGEDAADAYQRGLQAEVDRMQNANYMAPNLGSKSFTSAQDAGHGLAGGIHGLLAGIASRVVHGAPLNDAERAAVVAPSIGDLSTDYLMALLKSPKPTGLLGSQYAVAPLALTSGAAAGQ